MKSSQAIEQIPVLGQRLSPRQVLYAQLLEMTAPEVEEEVRRQLDENPALEVADEPSSKDSLDESAAEMAEDDQPYQSDVTTDYEDDPADRYDAPRSSSAVDPSSWQVSDDSPDLMSMLNKQIDLASLDSGTQALGKYIIGNLDPNGYLTRSLQAMADDIAINLGIEVDMDRMRQAYKAVRDLDPAGVGAADLRDCLMLQLGRKPISSLPLKIAREIIDKHFDLFTKKHYERLEQQLGLVPDNPDFDKAIKIILSLNPKPGASIEPSEAIMKTAQITPDVVVEEATDGRWTVSLASRLPDLQVEKTFAIDRQAPRNKRDRDAQAFIRLKRDQAEDFIGALRLRARTLLDVTEAIVKRQSEFFSTGDSSKLRPMILKDISADTGLDLSAISRATSGKYVATETGVYPLKMFFNEAPIGDDTSSHEYLQQIKEIIEGEDKRHPLGDKDIMEVLNKKGYAMARRTVGKYREKLGYPVARLRRSSK